MARVGIVVPTVDPERSPAKQAIAAVRRTTAHLDVAVHAIADSGPHFRLARSLNRGMDAEPDAEALVLLNDDAFMDDGWLDAMLDAARQHPEAGVVGAVLRYPDGRVQHAGARFLLQPHEMLGFAWRAKAPLWGVRRVAQERLRTTYYRVDHYTRVDPRHRLDYLTGAAMLITRKCHDAIGGYDERYRFGFEDSDYCLRALEAGFELALATGATGMHLERATGPRTGPWVDESYSAFQVRWQARDILRLTRGGRRKGIHHSS